MFRRFMRGRYGWDNVNTALLFAGLILGLLGYVPVLFGLRFLQFLPLAAAIWRSLSRDIERRRTENLRLWQWLERCKARFSRLRHSAAHRPRESRTHKLYSCPHCAKTLRVPRGKGKIRITCPVCHERFTAET